MILAFRIVMVPRPRFSFGPEENSNLAKKRGAGAPNNASITSITASGKNAKMQCAGLTFAIDNDLTPLMIGCMY